MNRRSRPPSLSFPSQASSTRGLTRLEVEERRLLFGRNALKGRRSVHPVVLLLRHLFNVMSLILFVAVALAFAVEEWIEGGVIAAIIVLNTIVGFLQVRGEGREEGRGGGREGENNAQELGSTPTCVCETSF